jgi:hypothetical protein
MNIFCRIGIHKKKTEIQVYPYGNPPLPSIFYPFDRRQVLKCAWCGRIFMTTAIPPDHPNCECSLQSDPNGEIIVYLKKTGIEAPWIEHPEAFAGMPGIHFVKKK